MKTKSAVTREAHQQKEEGYVESGINLQEMTQSVVISKSSFDQATPIIITANTSFKDNEDYDLRPLETAANAKMQVTTFEFDQEDKQPQQSNVFVWGDNSYGQLAIQPECQNLVLDPVAIDLSKLGRISQIACGASHTIMLSDSGLVFAMGDNSQGQLGFPTSQALSSSEPLMVSGINVRIEQAISQVHCADYSSFVVITATKDDEADEVYSWGRAFTLESIPKSTPSQIEFQDCGEAVFKIKTISVGSDHAAILTNDRQVHTWGNNRLGQLGLGDTENQSTPLINKFIPSEITTTRVTCGKQYSFLISDLNEIFVSGKLPFSVQNEKGEDIDHISTFQSIAQFDSRVKILQVQTSRFASIVVDPIEEGQPRELFFWGQSPLGVFNELTPLNQLFAGSYEQSGDNSGTSGQIFNVKAVQNGLNFCIFIEQDSGMTYQIGAENLIDPYIDDALVSLSELRDAQFDDPNRFACGGNFVIGESLTQGPVVSNSPMKRPNEPKIRTLNDNRISAFKPQLSEISTSKKIIEEDPTAEDMSMQLVSPADSKQSFPQRALYHGSISPSTPTDPQQSVLSYSGKKSLNLLQHKDLAQTLKKINSCMPIMSETPKACQQTNQNFPEKIHMRNQSCKHEDDDPERHIKASSSQNTLVDIANNSAEREFNKTEELPRFASARFLASDHDPDATIEKDSKANEKKDDVDQKVVSSYEDQRSLNMSMKDSQAVSVTEIVTPVRPDNAGQKSNLEAQKNEVTNYTNRDFSPNISPISKGMKARDVNQGYTTNPNQQCWLQMADGASSCDNLQDSITIGQKQQSPFLRVDSSGYYIRAQIEDSCSKLASQLPLQMRHSQHIVYQAYPHQAQALVCSPDGRQDTSLRAVDRYLPVQPQQSQQAVTPATHRAQAYHTFQNPVQMSYASARSSSSAKQLGSLNLLPQQSYDPNNSGFLSHHQHQQQQFAPQQYYEMIFKEKFEQELQQQSVQLKESQRQLDKSRKEYAKLLSQVDEDQEETAQLRDTVRKQESQISELRLKSDDQDLVIERLNAEKIKLEFDARSASKSNQASQCEIQSLHQRLKELQESFQKKQAMQECRSKKCRQAEQDLDAQLQKRSKELYDLTVKLGCLQTENCELKSQLDEHKDAIEKRHDSSRLLIEQELQDACEQIKDLSEAFSLAQEQLLKLQAEKASRAEVVDASVQTIIESQKNKRSKAIQVGNSKHAIQKQEDDNFPKFKLSNLKSSEKDACYSRQQNRCSPRYGSPKLAQPVEVFEMPTLPQAAFEVINQHLVIEKQQSFEASDDPSCIQPELLDNSFNGGAAEFFGDNSLREFKQIEKSSVMNRQSMELPKIFYPPMAQRQNFVLKRNNCHGYEAIQTPTTETAGSVKGNNKRHNFMAANQSNASIEPRILRNDSNAVAIANLTAANTHSEQSVTEATKHCEQKRQSHDQQSMNLKVYSSVAQSTNVHAHVFTTLDLSIDQLEDPQNSSSNNEQECEVEGEESWQTFKPMTAQSTTTCPVDRYSLKRHKEIFSASKESQKDDAQMAATDRPQQQKKQQQQSYQLQKQKKIKNSEIQKEFESNKEKQQPSQPGSVKSARRCKSNQDCQSSGGCNNNKIRRLRSQRKAEAITKYVDRSIADIDNEDNISHISIGAKSSVTMTTPHRCNADSRIKLRPNRQSSQLKQPTPIRKSAALKATLDRIASQTIDVDDLPCAGKTTTPQNLQPLSMPKSFTPGKMADLPTNSLYTLNNNLFGKSARGQITSNTFRQRTNITPSSNIGAPNGFGSNSSQTLQMSLQQNRSATPRINKSVSALNNNGSNWNAGNKISRNSANMNSQLSATARRVAYEQRRKLALQTMKEMKKSTQRTNVNVNRQARAAVASLPNVAAPGNMSISIGEEQPIDELPQQTCPPVMSVYEDSELTALSTRNANGITINDMSPIITTEVEQNALPEQVYSPNNQLGNLSAKQQHQNPFLSTPVANTQVPHAQDNSLTRDSNHELYKSKSNTHSMHVGEGDTSRASGEKDHLHSMKAKLAQIQSNKYLLESKIKEYESQLLRISHDPVSQEIMAKFKPSISASISCASIENIVHDQNASNSQSEYTLGESTRTSNLDKRNLNQVVTPRHTFNSNERTQKRHALQQLHNNSSSNAGQSERVNQNSMNSTTHPSSKSYRDCMRGPVQAPVKRIAAPATIQPRSLYKNQPIFKR